MTEPTSSTEELRQQGHEPNRFSARIVLAAGAGLAVTIALAFWLVFAMFEDYAARGEPPSELPPSLRQAIQQSGEPALSPRQPLQLEQMRAAERKVLNTYAWIDKQEGLARIPIDRAIDILAKNGLPARDAGKVDQNKTRPKQSSDHTTTDAH